MADFLEYLFKCAATFIQDTHANGKDVWDSVQGDIDFVLSHPNGWEGFQQTQMREAIVKAGLIPDTTKGHSRVSFVTEGEASLHFSIDNGLPPSALAVSFFRSLGSKSVSLIIRIRMVMESPLSTLGEERLT